MAASIGGSPPIEFFYSRLHDCIRKELNCVHEHLCSIHRDDSLKELQEIQQKLKFLSQVYSYHSVAEDEIVYPALDSKVKNVTLPYRIEHADEGHLLVQLMQLLTSLPSSESNLLTTLRELACKVEEVSTTIRQHLEKEEEQLFPLLCEHFTYTEQASLIAQFLFCIPLTTVQSFLDWIQPTSRQEERNQLAAYMHHAVSDDLLLSLLDAWLDPDAQDDDGHVTSCLPASMPDGERAPLEQITNVHRSIDSTLVGFIQEARRLLEEDIWSVGLESLLEKHRFLKDVCRFHMLSEEEIMFPELLKQCHMSEVSYEACHQEHLIEGDWFDNLGRLLTDVRSNARRGCKEARKLLEQVIDAAETMRESLGDHMTREEKEVFPVLQAKLGSGEQCLILWRTLKMMPLRLLERVMPWISSQLSESEYAGWITALRIGGMEDSTAVELLSRWAQRGCSDVNTMSVHLESPSVRKAVSHLEIPELYPSKRLRMDGSPQDRNGQPNPLDHIFQFHRALRRDFRLFESETNKFVKTLETQDAFNWKTHIQELKGRFTFIWGIYQAHSKIEDEVVFPELEKKEETQNSTHSYMLDHRHEKALFETIQQMLDALMSSDDVAQVRDLAMTLRRKCAAVRSALETHIRAEETELWPLLIEHFSIDEQHRIVGLIIGRTGAEVLQTMLPWVSSCFTEEEKDAMMDSLHKVAKNTRFDKWMQNWNAPGQPFQSDPQPSDSDSLTDVAEYLRTVGLMVSSSSPGNFHPSFEDMFRMNQSQLEAAVRHVSSDESLEPQRKSYLIQRILVLEYITRQQAKSQTTTAEIPRSYFSKEKGILGCVHYQRNCALVAPCCQQVYVCRLCHDAEQDHKMNRYAVESIVCMACGTQQPVSNSCISCRMTFARYHCGICRLYDDQPDKDIYHCPFCNVCRKGKGLGIDFFHCMECNACMHTNLFNKHHCKQKLIEADCPVCQENMFDSSLPIKELRCGHYMHSACFDHYSKWNYRCPFCLKSLGDMSVYFRMLDTFLASDPMPEQFKSIQQSIVCHDCGKQSNAPFHYVYHSCQHCHSYNTRLL